jgi:hypothetical protein
MRREEIMKQISSSKRRYARIGLAAAIGAICLGTAGVAAAQTSNSIYGNFRWSVNHVDSAAVTADTSMGIAALPRQNSTLRADNNASRLGFRGETTGNALTAFYQLEGGVDNDGGGAWSTRFYQAGVKGGFGAVTVGRTSPAYKLAGSAVNPFTDTGVAGVNGAYATSGAAYGLSNMTNSYANNTLAYSSPKVGPVVLNGAVYVDDSANDQEHDYAAGIAFAEGSLVVGAQYYQTGDNANAWANAAGVTATPGADRGQKAYRIHGSFGTGPIKLGVSAEMLDPDAAGAGDVKYYFLAGTYSLAQTTRISASFGMVDDGADEGKGYNLGLFHDLVPNTTVYALYSKADLDNRDDTDIFSVGLVYNFNMKL